MYSNCWICEFDSITAIMRATAGSKVRKVKQLTSPTCFFSSTIILSLKTCDEILTKKNLNNNGQVILEVVINVSRWPNGRNCCQLHNALLKKKNWKIWKLDSIKKKLSSVLIYLMLYRKTIPLVLFSVNKAKVNNNLPLIDVCRC